jgi:hypothetical protein
MAGDGVALHEFTAALRDEVLEPKDILALSAYEKALADAIGDGSEITNGSPFHARLVLSKIFEMATSEVVVYSGHLRRVGRDERLNKAGLIWAYQPLIDAAKRFLRKPGTKLSILVQNCIDGSPLTGGMDHPFLSTLFGDNDRAGRLELIVARGYKTRVLPISPRHFAVADEKMYRLETTDKGVWATANFNEPKTAKFLSGYFSELVERLARLTESEKDARGYFLKVSRAEPITLNIPPEFLGTVTT